MTVNDMPNRCMLSLKGVVAGYGDATVLRGVDLEILQGEIVALVGANGAGKTTLLRAISGLVQLDDGAIDLNGARIDRLHPTTIVAHGIAHVPEGRRLFAGLSVRENLLLGAIQTGNKTVRAQRQEEILALFPNLVSRQDQLAGTLSGGEQQMVAIGRGLMSSPKLLMIDELSLGLAPMVVAEILERLRQISGHGTSILIVEQDVLTALEVSRRAYVLENGAISLSGPSSELIVDDRVRLAYFGL